MLEGIDVSQRIEFVSTKDKTEPKTVFVLRPLSGIDRINIRQNSSKSAIEAILETSIVEIRHGKDLSVKDYIKTLDIDVINEIVGKINDISDIKDDDRKNS